MLRITSNEKAVIGGLVTGLSALVIQLQQSGQFTTKEFAFAAGAWLVTQLSVWLTANTPKPVATPVQ